MKVAELIRKFGLTQLTSEGTDKEIRDVYIGDLLSVVMNKCDEGSVWITSQTHVNILNVADLNDIACVLFAGGAKADESLIEKAADMGIALLSSDMEAYELAWKIHEVME